MTTASHCFHSAFISFCLILFLYFLSSFYCDWSNRKSFQTRNSCTHPKWIKYSENTNRLNRILWIPTNICIIQLTLLKSRIACRKYEFNLMRSTKAIRTKFMHNIFPALWCDVIFNKPNFFFGAPNQTINFQRTNSVLCGSGCVSKWKTSKCNEWESESENKNYDDRHT